MTGVRFAPGRTGKAARRVVMAEEMDDEEDEYRMSATIKPSGLSMLLLVGKRKAKNPL